MGPPARVPLLLRVALSTAEPLPPSAAVWTRAVEWGRVGPLGLPQGEDLGTGECFSS